jgi:hypothetical protein
MTTRLFTIAAAALAAALAACTASVPMTRTAASQASSLQLNHGMPGPALDCGYDDGGFGAPDAMKLAPNAFSGCRSQ